MEGKEDFLSTRSYNESDISFFLSNTFQSLKYSNLTQKIFHDKILLPTLNFNGRPNTVVHRNSMSAITWPRSNKNRHKDVGCEL